MERRGGYLAALALDLARRGSVNPLSKGTVEPQDLLDDVVHIGGGVVWSPVAASMHVIRSDNQRECRELAPLPISSSLRLAMPIRHINPRPIDDTSFPSTVTVSEECRTDGSRQRRAVLTPSETTLRTGCRED